MSVTAASLPALLIARSDATPNVVATRTATGGYWAESTWRAQLAEAALAHAALIELGVTPASVVVVATSSRREWPLVTVAAQALGAATLAVATDASPETVADIAATRQCSLWVAEDEEQLDKARAAGVDASTPILVLDPRGIDADQDGLHLWGDVVATGPDDALARGGDGSTALDTLRSAVEALVADQVAAILPAAPDDPEGQVTTWTHAQLADATLDAFGPGLAPGDEYLSFLPPAWAAEHHAVLTEAFATGAVVSYGARTGGVLGDLRAIQPTVVQAPGAFWDALSVDVQRRLEDSSRVARSRFAKLRARTSTPSRRGLGWVGFLRPLLSRIGLRRVHRAVALGAVEPDTLAFLAAIGIDLELTGAPMHHVTTSEPESTAS